MKETRNRGLDSRRLCRGLTAAAGLAIVLHLCFGSAAAATERCQSRLLHTRKAHPADLIQLRSTPGVPSWLIPEAVAAWERCSNYGVGFPAFVAEGHPLDVTTPVRSLTVRFLRRSGSSACGRFRGHEVHVRAVNARGEEVHCGSPVLILAHELGHVLGLADADEDATCHEQIMAQIQGSNRRRVHESECETASQRWLTTAEQRTTESTGVTTVRSRMAGTDAADSSPGPVARHKPGLGEKPSQKKGGRR